MTDTEAPGVRSRPISVTVVCVLALVYGAFTLGEKIFILGSPENREHFLEFFDVLNAEAPVQLPVEVHLGFSLLASAVYLVTGAAMLIGRNRARIVFLVWGALALAFTAVASGITYLLIIKAAVWLVFLYLLMRAPAAAFFGNAPSTAP